MFMVNSINKTNTSGLKPTFHTQQFECLIWPSVHYSSCIIWKMAKSLFVGPHRTSPVSYYPHLVFFGLLQTFYVPLYLLQSTWLQMSIPYNFIHNSLLGNSLGWTFIHWLQQFLLSLKPRVIGKLWLSFTVHIVSEFFPTTVLMLCFMTTRDTSFLVNT